MNFSLFSYYRHYTVYASLYNIDIYHDINLPLMGSWWFNCRPNPGCQCFSLTTPVKIPGRITYCFWQTPRSCGNLIAVRIHISEFTRKKSIQNSVFKPFLSTPEHRKVTLYFGVICIHIYFWNAGKYLKEQYFKTAPPQRLGAEWEKST